MMVPLRVTITLHISDRIGAIGYEDGNSTSSIMFTEEESIRRGTHDVVVENPNSGWHPHFASDVLVAVECLGPRIHAAFDRRAMVMLLWREHNHKSV